MNLCSDEKIPVDDQESFKAEDACCELLKMPPGIHLPQCLESKLRCPWLLHSFALISRETKTIDWAQTHAVGAMLADGCRSGVVGCSGRGCGQLSRAVFVPVG